jgi:hypothetical protein
MKMFEAGHHATEAPARATFSTSEASEPLEDADAVLALGVEPLLEVGDERPVEASRALVLDLDALAPLQVERGALVGQGVVADQPHGHARDERFVELVPEVVVRRDDAGKDVLVGAELVAVLGGYLRPFDGEQLGTLEILLPVRPVQVELARRGAYAGKVIAVEMVVNVDQRREGGIPFAEPDIEPRRGAQSGDTRLVDLERPRGDDRIRGDDRESAQRVRTGHSRSFVSLWMNTIV